MQEIYSNKCKVNVVDMHTKKTASVIYHKEECVYVQGSSPNTNTCITISVLYSLQKI